MTSDTLDKNKIDQKAFDWDIEETTSLKRRLSKCIERVASLLNLYCIVPPGWITIDKATVVREANTNFCAILDATPENIIGKPLSLFIDQEDIVLFFARRNQVFSNKTPEIFDLRFRREKGESIHCRVECKLTKPQTSDEGKMRMAVADISEFRQKEDHLQFKDDLLNIIFSLSKDLTNTPASEYRSVVNHCLKTIGLFTGADRCFICRLQNKDSKILNAFEWCSHKRFSKKAVMDGIDTDTYPKIVTDIRRNKVVYVQDLHRLSHKEKKEYEAFHAPGVKSLLTVPMIYGGTPVGIFGIEAVNRIKSWDSEITDLLKHISGAIVNLMIRRRLLQMKKTGFLLGSPSENKTFQKKKDPRTKEGLNRRDARVGTVISTTLPGRDIQREPKNALQQKWRFRRAKIKDSHKAITLRKNESNIINIVCPRCGGEKNVGHSQLAGWGHMVEALCPCGKQFIIKIESREAFRKNVHLDGFIIKEDLENQSDRENIIWGDIIVTNISKKGVGFIVLDNASIQKGDLIKVKFKLDNTLGSTIEKEAAVIDVSDDYVGCVFTKADKYDVTLGFYLM